jgi:prenyltransferase beta subunit
MLNAQSLVDGEKLRSFLMSTQDERIGGFAKYSDSCSGQKYLAEAVI